MMQQPEFNEKDLLDRAIQKFQETTGIFMNMRVFNGDDPRGDAQVFLLGDGMPTDPFFVIGKKWVTHATLGPTLMQFKKPKGDLLLITEYVNPNMAEDLKERQIQFIDTAGNAYINHPPLYIFVKGNKPPKQTKRVQRAFKPTGLKVIFAFLCDPTLVNAPYRDIEKAAGVALGAIGGVIRELKEKGFLVELEKRNRRLLNKEKLFEKWVTDYAEKLRPQLLIETYKATNPEWFNTADLKFHEAYWGGEMAAEKLTHYLKPETKTLYLKGKVTEFLKAQKLVKDPQGDIELREVFWDFDYKYKNHGLVPPLLVYADLLATGLDRNIETAKILFDNELAEHFGKY